MDYRNKSWYYGKMSRKDANDFLRKPHSKPGDFLIRESERQRGSYVLCVREYKKLDPMQETINHYIIDYEEIATESGSYKLGDLRFGNLDALVDYYSKRNLETSCLIRPAPREDAATLKLSHNKGAKIGSIERNELAKDYDEIESKAGPTINEVILPALARVVQERIKNPYDPFQLTIKVGDELEVLEINRNGTWRGRLNGVEGTFPFTHIRFLPQHK